MFIVFNNILLDLFHAFQLYILVDIWLVLILSNLAAIFNLKCLSTVKL